MEETRIKGKEVPIDGESVKSFFDRRGSNWSKDDDSDYKRYILTLFQDDNPDLAVRRDAYEKELINSLIDFSPDAVILDIGCGIGRWADNFRDRDISRYVGIDFSGELIKIAKRLFQDDRFIFDQGSFQETVQVLSDNGYPMQYDYLFVNGVFMYVNDEELEPCFSAISKLLKKGGTLYLKDSVGTEERFTLKDFESKELKSEYSAIYRSLKEWKKLFEKYLPEDEYEILRSGDLFEENEKNRKETKDYYWIVKRI